MCMYVFGEPYCLAGSTKRAICTITWAIITISYCIHFCARIRILPDFLLANAQCQVQQTIRRCTDRRVLLVALVQAPTSISIALS